MEAGKSYTEHYHRLDYVLTAVETGPVGVVRTGSELTDPQKHREFHADCSRPYEGDDGLVIRLTGGPKPTCFLVGSLRRSEWFDTPERVKLMNGLVVHLQQALRTKDKLAALAHDRLDFAAALEVVRHGITIIGSECYVRHLNSAAERILRAEDGLHTQSGRIAAAGMYAQRALHRALHGALNDEGSNICGGQSFTCARPSGKRPYVVHVLPLHQAHADETSSEAAALVLVIDPEHETEPPAALLRRLHGLPSTEAEVVFAHVAWRGPEENLRRVVTFNNYGAHPPTTCIRQNRHTPPSRTRPIAAHLESVRSRVLDAVRRDRLRLRPRHRRGSHPCSAVAHHSVFGARSAAKAINA